MSLQRDIPWFNPRQLDDATVLALSTGRESLLRDFFKVANQRQQHSAAGRHWLVTGRRGAGKSFFLRLVQASFPSKFGAGVTFALLPEELPNVYSPHEWLQEVERMLPSHWGDPGKPSAWHVKDESVAWDAALQSLLNAFTGDLLVIGVENFDQVIGLAFDNEVRASRLRNLMESEPRIMLLATSVEGTFDENYTNRLFRQFEHHSMPLWDHLDHRHYLESRTKLQGCKVSHHQLARIDAYSRYTGGSARIAAVLAAVILEEQDLLNAGADLNTTLDRMSDYYRALFERMPVNTRKLFDALIRGGEPASQVEVAARLDARQSDASRAFRWLVDFGYVVNEQEKGSKSHRYRVADRLFVQFYRMRYLEPNQPSQLAILADLLAATIEFGEKWRYAETYLAAGNGSEAQLMAKLACEDRGVNVGLLPDDQRNAASLVSLGKQWRQMDEIFKDGIWFTTEFIQSCIDNFQDDDGMRCAYQNAKNLAAAVNRNGQNGSELVALLECSFVYVSDYEIFLLCLSDKSQAK